MNALKYKFDALGYAPVGVCNITNIPSTTDLATIVTKQLETGSVARLQDGTEYYFNSTATGGDVAGVGAGYWFNLRKMTTGAVTVNPSCLPRFFRALKDYRQDLATAIPIVGMGSSVGVGADTPNPATQAPVANFAARLNAIFDKAGIYNFTVNNQSVNGTVVTDGDNIFTGTIAPLNPKLVHLAYGMNDGASAAYNSGQTYPFVYTRLVNIVNKARLAGADVVLTTTPHPHTGRATWSLLTSGLNQVYPTAVASPVADAALYPTPANSVVSADYLNVGTAIPAAVRYLRVNQAIRQVGIDLGVPVIDVERYWFKAVLQYGEDALFNTGEIVHPNLLGHQLSYHAAHEDFLNALFLSYQQGGRADIFSGRVGVNTTENITAGLAVRPCLAGEKVLLLEDAAGNDLANISETEFDVSGFTKLVNSSLLEMKGEGYAAGARPNAQIKAKISYNNPAAAFNIPIPLGFGKLYVAVNQNGLGIQIREFIYCQLNNGAFATITEVATNAKCDPAGNPAGPNTFTAVQAALNLAVTPAAGNSDIIWAFTKF